VAGKGGRPPQVTMEALLTGCAGDTGWSEIISGHFVATKR
jgi:hypothetical protein